MQNLYTFCLRFLWEISGNTSIQRHLKANHSTLSYGWDGISDFVIVCILRPSKRVGVYSWVHVKDNRISKKSRLYMSHECHSNQFVEFFFLFFAFLPHISDIVGVDLLLTLLDHSLRTIVLFWKAHPLPSSLIRLIALAANLDQVYRKSRELKIKSNQMNFWKWFWIILHKSCFILLLSLLLASNYCIIFPDKIFHSKSAIN